MWLLRKLTPDFKTIADFRRDHTRGLEAVCREFTLLCKELDLFGGELVAIDGSKFRAVNSAKRNFSRRGLGRLLAGIDVRIVEYLGSLDTQDARDSALPSVTPAQSVEALQPKIDTLRTRRESCTSLLAQLEASGETQLSLTDPESRSMKVRGGTEICYNVQTAVDAKHQLIVANDVTNAPTDREALSSMATAAHAVLGATELDVMEQRLREQPELSTRRKAIVEHPFGTMKRGMSQGYFLLRGLAKVRAAFSLTVLAYNLRRVINIVGIPRLMAALA